MTPTITSKIKHTGFDSFAVTALKFVQVINLVLSAESKTELVESLIKEDIKGFESYVTQDLSQIRIHQTGSVDPVIVVDV